LLRKTPNKQAKKFDQVGRLDNSRNSVDKL